MKKTKRFEKLNRIKQILTVAYFVFALVKYYSIMLINPFAFIWVLFITAGFNIGMKGIMGERLSIRAFPLDKEASKYAGIFLIIFALAWLIFL